MMKTLFISFLLLCIVPLKNDILIGKIVKVSDGDTVIILTEDKQQIKIRLYGIDAPEKGQDFSNKARDFVNELCYNKKVKV